MKDIRITAQRQKKELKILMFCFSIAFIINIYSIITFKTDWTESYRYIGYVLVIAAFLYVLLAILRFAFIIIKKAFKQRK